MVNKKHSGAFYRQKKKENAKVLDKMPKLHNYFKKDLIPTNNDTQE